MEKHVLTKAPRTLTGKFEFCANALSTWANMTLMCHKVYYIMMQLDVLIESWDRMCHQSYWRMLLDLIFLKKSHLWLK